MRLEQLYYFQKINEEKSMSKAAEKLFISQPALSMAIGHLEKELGVQLFERSWEGVSLTEDGEGIVEQVQEVLHNVELIKAKTVQKRHPMEMEIIATPAVASVFLPNVVVHLQNKYENININIEEKSVAFVIEMLKKSKRGMARPFIICPFEDTDKALLDHMKSMHLNADFLQKDKFYCVAGKNTFAGKIRIEPLECRDKMLLSCKNVGDYEANGLDSASDIWHMLYTVEHKTTVSSVEMMKQMISSNVGITFMPGLLVYNDYRVKNGDIRLYEVDGLTEELYYYLIYPERKPEEFEQDFIRLVKQEIIDFAKDRIN